MSPVYTPVKGEESFAPTPRIEYGAGFGPLPFV